MVAKDAFTFEATQLQLAVAYTFWVRAVTAAGAGAESEPLVVHTEQQRQPPSPDAPTFVGSPDCASIRLKLPPLQPSSESSCDDADALLLQVKAGSRAYWEKAEPLTPPEAGGDDPRRGSVLTLRSDPMTVYQFRALARNSAGISTPGSVSPPTMVNRYHAALREPPKPTATSSASYTVSWGATLSACQPDVRWDLLYSQVAGEDHWHSIAENVATEFVELPTLRCDEGCVFKAHARAVDGSSEYSNVSAPLPTKPLPRARAGAVRLEMRLEPPASGVSGSDGPSARTDGAIARGLTALTDVTVSIVERRCMLDDGACYFVFDLSLETGPLAGDTAQAMGAARNLMRALREGGNAGGAAEALRDVDLQYGLRLVSQDSDITQRIEPAISVLDTLRSAAGVFNRVASPMEGLSALAALVCVCCAYCGCRICLRRSHTHSEVRQADDDDDDAWPEYANGDGDSNRWLDDIYGGGAELAKPLRVHPQVSAADESTYQI